MAEIRFLALGEIIRTNASQVMLFGGIHGIRDHRLLESAACEPQASFGGKYLHENTLDIAAAYAHGISKNHPFIDANKRTGVICALLFLEYNGFRLDLSQDELYKLGIGIATSKMPPPKIVTFFNKKVVKN